MAEAVHFHPVAFYEESIQQSFGHMQTWLDSLITNANIYHVGSTALPDGLTKGDLDIQVRLTEHDFANAKKVMSQRFKINPGGFIETEGGISFDHLDNARNLSVGIHLTIKDSPSDIQWRFHRVLLQREDLRREYDEIKKSFNGKSMSEYRIAKGIFFSKLQALPEYIELS